MHHEAEDLVAGAVAANGTASLLDDARVVAPEDHGVVVLEAHAGEHSGGDRVVDRIDRGGVHAHEDLVVGRGGDGQVLAELGRGIGLVNGDGSHGGSSTGQNGA